jgi:hypothetical protein
MFADATLPRIWITPMMATTAPMICSPASEP